MIIMALHTTVARSSWRVALGTALFGEWLKAVLKGLWRIAIVTGHDVGQRIDLVTCLAVGQMSLGQMGSM